MKKQNILLVVIMAIFVFTPDLFASSAGMPWEGPLTQIRNSLSGPVAGVIALIGVVAAGAGLIFGSQEMGAFMKTIIYLILVISLVITANVVISFFSASGILI